MTVQSESVGSSIPSALMGDGRRIPCLGFGVYQIEDGPACESAVAEALDAGYRHVDTAWIYGNEGSVGAAVEASGIPREEIFITTKSPFDLSQESVRRVFRESLDKLRTDYVDLYLIHWPMADELLPGAWDVLCELREAGRCRSIGVSNFTARRFDEAFFSKGCSLPAVNQVELHVFNQQRELVAYCRDRKMLMEAYSPLAQARWLDDPALCAVAAEAGRSPAQVMLRWLVQHGIVVIPKSVTPSRIRENATVFDFELSAEQMAALDALERGASVQEWRPKNYY